MVTGRKDAWWLTLLLIVCVELCLRYQLRGPSPLPADSALEAFSAGRAFATLQRILGKQAPHPTGSAANDRVRTRLIDELERLGLDVEVQETPRRRHSPDKLYNVLARLPNTTSQVRPLVLATHYDSVSAGPGAADAGSCVAALLETVVRHAVRRILQATGLFPVYRW